jgi:hypothetical protein
MSLFFQSLKVVLFLTISWTDTTRLMKDSDKCKAQGIFSAGLFFLCDVSTELGVAKNFIDSV